ncbi:MAG: hypothetical protein ACYTFQ_30745, partial [Planctomycetota bacterium]
MGTRGKEPMILFGGVEDFTAWSRTGTGSEAGSATDPLGGTNAYTLTDSDAATTVTWDSESVALNVNDDGEAIVNVFVKQGTADGPATVGLYDTTAATMRHRISLTWAATVPTLATVTGSGTLFDPILVGNAWYLIRFSAAAIVDGNSHDLRIQADNSAVSETGTLLVYARSAIAFGLWLDDAMAFSQPRDGSQVAKTTAGVEDAWITGTDEFLLGNVRWVYPTDQATPHNY